MNILGAVIFITIGFGLLWFIKWRDSDRKSDYSQYPKAMATVLGAEDFGGERWIVKFHNEEGKEVLGRDNELTGSTFHPERYHFPKRKMETYVYYWKKTGNSKYFLNNVLIEYDIHFCDDTLYELSKKSIKRSNAVIRIIAVCMTIAGVLIFLQ